MRATTIAIIAIILIALTVPATIIAIEFGTQTSTIVLDGKTYANTADGIQELKDVEYMSAFVAFAKPMPINSLTPVSLPHTAVPHGDYTCTINGSIVTQTSPCN